MGTSDTLRSVIDAGRSSKRLDELSSARVIGKIALQIHAAQQKAGAGKAVGPISPINVKLAPSGEATLELAEVTSLGYSSPEQINGSSGDRRSDIFSLGTVLWEALTHHRLFDAMNDAAVRIAVLEREIQPPSEVNANIPAELSAICMRALSRNPTDRYQSLKAMAVEIEEFLEEAGHGDGDDRIAAYLAALNEPKPVKIEMPPPTHSPKPSEPPPVRAGSPSQPPPSMLGEPPVQPVSQSPSGAALAAALANAGTTPPLPKAIPATTSIGIAPAPSVDEWQDRPSEHPPVGATTVPIPTLTPADSTELRTDKSTISVAVPPPVNAIEAKHAEAKKPAVVIENKPDAVIVADHKPTLIDAKAETPPLEAEPVKAEAPTPVAIPKITEPAAQPSNNEGVPTPAAAVKSAPHPASVVALGPIPGKDKDVLGGWGWGTDKLTAIAPDGYVAEDDELVVPPENSRKPLLYIGGVGLGVMTLVVIIMFAFGGSSSTKKPTAAAKPETSSIATAKEPPPPPPSGDTNPPAAQPPEPPLPPTTTETPAPAAATAPPPTPVPAAATTPEPPKAEPPKAEPPKAEPPKTEPPKISSPKTEPPKTEPPKTEPPKTEPPKTEPPKTEPPKTEPPKTEPPKTEHRGVAKVAKTDPKRKTAKAGLPKTAQPVNPYAETPPKAGHDKAAKTEPKSDAPKTETKTDVETAYRVGLQQFARGDTTGALASLRTSLAGNPNYAPTWRGLGLVFEKMGEKDQARAAFKRYLQLAPGASDADAIKSRLEKLGS